MRVLMVCLGNICRSPLAEGILKTKIKQQGKSWKVDSAGTGAYHSGELPDSRSIKVGLKYGIDIRDQRARQFKVNDFDQFDHILVMDSSNYQNVMRLARTEEDRAKVKMIMNYVSPRMNAPVPDPYYGNDGFEQVYQMLDEACDAFIQQEG